MLLHQFLVVRLTKDRVVVAHGCDQSISLLNTRGFKDCIGRVLGNAKDLPRELAC
jgi:hypothetical protein